jgi:hypothetical protein
MASCERCGNGGLDPRVLVVDSEQKLIGPCCSVSKVQYHVEMSSQNGFLARLSAFGVNLQFQRTPQEISQWLNSQSRTVPTSSTTLVPPMT